MNALLANGKMKASIFGMVIVSAFMMVSCGTKQTRRDVRPRASVQLSLLETYGAVKAKVSSRATSDQVVTVDLVGNTPKVKVKLPVGSVKQNDLLNVSEGTQFDPTLIRERTNINMDIHPVGIPTLLRLESGNDIAASITVALRRPQKSALSSDSAAYVVLFRMMKDSGTIVEGIIPPSLTNVSDSDYVSFPARSLGVFQLAEIVDATPAAEALTGNSFNDVIEIPSGSQLGPSFGNNAPIRIYDQAINVVIPGQTLTVKGENFRNVIGMMRGKIIETVKVKSASELSVTIPSYSASGVQRITLRQNGVAATVWVVINASSSNSVVLATSANDVCSDKPFVSLKEDGMTAGSRVCLKTTTCTEAGQTNCMTTDDHPSVSKTTLAAMSSPSPTASPAAAASCAADGQIGCLTTGRYKSVDTTTIAAADIRSGKAAGGISGILGDCIVDGQTNCVSNTNFPAVQASGLAVKVISGSSVAGVSGSYTPDFPSADYVLETVTTNHVNGKLRLPAAAHVNTANGAYGAGGNASTPLLGACASDGATGCVATANYPAVDKVGKLLSSSIKTGITIAGIAGAVIPTPADCAQDNATGCVANTGFPAADLSLVTASNIKTGVSMVGVLGNYGGGALQDCVSDGEVGCKAVNAFRAIDATKIVANNIKQGVTIGSTTGALVPTPGNCSDDGLVGCVTVAAFPSVKIANYTAASLKSGHVVGGVAGSLSDCSADGQISCIAIAAYKAADMAHAVAGNLRNGVTVAGVAGVLVPTPNDCSSDGATGCVATTSFKAADMTKALAANIKTGVSIANVAGSVVVAPNDCSVDGGTSCVATASFKAVDASKLVAGNIKSGVTMASIAGSVVPSPSDCSVDGVAGCVTTSTFKSADMTKAVAGNILTSVTIAGVAGTVSAAPAACAADGAGSCVVNGTTYKAALMTSVIAANIKTGATVAGVAGSVVETPGNCSADGAGSCVVDGTNYKAALMTNAIAANVKSGVSIAGVAGAVVPTPSNCAADGAAGCVTTTRYKSADTSAYSDTDFKSGKTVGGIAGNMASCNTDGQQTCFIDTTSMFKAANATGLAASMIQSGIQLAGVTGTKMDVRSCRNTADAFDNVTSPGTTGIDIYDTIDDYNKGGITSPISSPWSSVTNTCNSSNFTFSAGAQYTVTDSLTGLVATSVNPQGSSKTWSAALTACKSLTWNSIGPNVWRLPTQKELGQLYIDGISRVDATKMGTLNQLFWSSTTDSDAVTQAWAVNLATGFANATLYTKGLTSLNVICVK